MLYSYRPLISLSSQNRLYQSSAESISGSSFFVTKSATITPTADPSLMPCSLKPLHIKKASASGHFIDHRMPARGNGAHRGITIGGLASLHRWIAVGQPFTRIQEEFIIQILSIIIRVDDCLSLGRIDQAEQGCVPN